MKRFRLLLAGTVGLLSLGLPGCLKAPDISTTPAIGFNSITHQRYRGTSTTVPADSLTIELSYQDGDGDLGLNDTELKLPQYAYPSRFSRNYFITLLTQLPNGNYVTLLSQNRTVGGLPLQADAYNGTYPHILAAADNKGMPIKGVIRYRFGFPVNSVYRRGEVARFDISIADRALHESNVVRTDTVKF